MEQAPEEFVNLILEFEGTKRKGYVPKDNQGNIIGKSGVTIGKGLDLGAQDENSLRSMGLEGELLNKLKPYVGVKGKEADEIADTLTINPEEEKFINTAVTTRYWNTFNSSFKLYTGYDSAELPDKARYAVASRFFNSGGSIFKTGRGLTNLTKQLRTRDYKAAADNIETWFNPKGKFKALVPRAQKEAALFRQGFQEAGTVKDFNIT